MRCHSKRPAAVAAAGLLLAGALAAQSPPGERQDGFRLIDDYLLTVDGAPAAGEIYAGGSSSAILVMAPELPSPVLLWPGSRVVETLQLLKVAKQPGGSVDLLPDPALAAQPPFEVRGGEVFFFVDGREAALKPKPPLLGFQETRDLAAYSRTYAARADAYAPGAAELERLRTEARDVRVQIFFGTWCPACGQMVPRVMKIADSLGESAGIDWVYYGLPQNFSGDAEAKKYDVTRVPTGVVLIGGRPVGRLSGEDWTRPERALAELLGRS